MNPFIPWHQFVRVPRFQNYNCGNFVPDFHNQQNSPWGQRPPHPSGVRHPNVQVRPNTLQPSLLYRNDPTAQQQNMWHSSDNFHSSYGASHPHVAALQQNFQHMSIHGGMNSDRRAEYRPPSAWQVQNTRNENGLSRLSGNNFSIPRHQIKNSPCMPSPQEKPLKTYLGTTNIDHIPRGHQGSRHREMDQKSESESRSKHDSTSQRMPCDTTMSEWKNSPRYWIYDKKRRRSSRAMKISVMSYNILSQSLLEEHSFLYQNCSYEDLDWSYRGPALIRQFEHHKSDVLCLQEVQENHWKTFFQPQLKSLGYEGYFVKRTGDKPDGCAILFRHKKFKLVEFAPVNFQRGGVLDRDNVGVILLLQPRKRYYRGSVRQICVATTHLLFNPRRGDVKLAQLMLFLAEIEKYSYLDVNVDKKACTGSRLLPEGRTQIPSNHPYCPVILCGDMNLEPESYLYDFITKGHIQYNACISQSLSGQSEGMGRGYSYVPTGLLSESLGINDHCQFIKHASNRVPLSKTGPDDKTHDSVRCELSQKDENKSNCAASERDEDKSNGAASQRDEDGSNNATPQRDGGESNSATPQRDQDESTNVTSDKIDKTALMNTGHAFHNFNFQSVYPQKSSLVTTHHGRASCMVDYIFYSSGQTNRSSKYETCSAESYQNKGKNKYDMKKRKRTESANGEKQCSPKSPSKTLRGERGHVAPIHNDQGKQEQSSSGQGMQSTDKDCSISNICYAKTDDQCNLEPGEILSSEDWDGSRLENRDHLSDSFSDKSSVVSKSSNSGPGNLDYLDHNDNMQNHIRKASQDEKSQSIQTLERLGYWSLLSSKDFKRQGCLPNNVFPSDHICLIAKFLLH